MKIVFRHWNSLPLSLDTLHFFSGHFDPSFIDLEPFFESYDDITFSNSLNEDYFNGFLTAQTRRLSTGMSRLSLIRAKNDPMFLSLQRFNTLYAQP